MIKGLVVLCLFLFTLNLAAHESIDSLQYFLSLENKNEKWVDEMTSQIEKMVNSDPKTALELTEQIYKQAEKLNYKNGLIQSKTQQANILKTLGEYPEAKAKTKEVLQNLGYSDSENKIRVLSILGNIYFQTSEYDSALTVFNQVEKLMDYDRNSFQFADLYNNQGNVYSLKGNYSKAIELYLKSAEIYQASNHFDLLAVVYNNIGTENRNLQDYKKSIKYYSLAADLNIKNKDFFNLAKNYSNMGVSYNEMDSVDTALYFYKKSLAISEDLGSTLVLAQNYVNIANLYEKKGDYEEALKLFNQSLSICKKAKITYGLVLNYMNIGNTNFLMGNFQMAISKLDSALIYATQIGLPKEESQIYERYSRVYKKMGDFENAFKYNSLFSAINDSLITVQKQKQIIDLQIKYETAQKEKENIELRILQANHNLTIISLFALVLVLLIILSWLVYRRKLMYKEKIIAEIKNRELHLNIETKNAELTQKALTIAQINEINQKLVSDLKTAMGSTKEEFNKNLADIIQSINSNLGNAKIWDEFELRFKEIHGNFYSTIVAKYPDLTPTEMRIVSLLRLNLNTKEIAEITKRSIKTIENMRINIRKKMNLEGDENLTLSILSIK